MEKQSLPSFERTFSTPQEELAYLRQQVARKEALLVERGHEVDSSTIASHEIERFAAAAPSALAPEHRIPAAEAEAITLALSPEAHDSKMEELISVMHERGIANALDIVARLGDPHIADDFHRFLVQYVKAGFSVSGLKERSPLARSLSMTLFEVALPDPSEEAARKPLKELLSSMEQLYSGLLSTRGEKGDADHFTIEVANANHSHEFVFYASIATDRAVLLEKQLLSIFPYARIIEKKDDYNIFNGSGATVAAELSLSRNPALPLRTYDSFDYDPLNVLLNSFSKIKKDGEGAALQLLVKPADDSYAEKYRKGVDELQKGKPFKDIFKEESLVKDFGKFLVDFASTSKKKDDDKKEKEKVVDAIALDAVKAKIATPIALAEVRIVASAQTEAEAQAILSDILSSFSQFENASGNRPTFEHFEKRKLTKLLDAFTYRQPDPSAMMPLSLREIASILHLPATGSSAAPQLRQARAATAPAPLDMPKQGVLLGTNTHRGAMTEVYMAPEDRLRHLYVIGQTGTGKTTLLKNMIVQDIQNGDGVCMIDPHGSDIEDILANIPKHRYEDVIYFDPGNVSRPMALNMLEYDERFPEQKTFVVNEMLSIFNKLFDMKTAGGPMFEQYFRNAVMLVIDSPASGSTLLDVSRVLANKAFREMKLAECKNPIVTQFWRDIAEKAGGEGSLANIVPYITSKFDVFLSNDIMRPIIAQQRSTFNFREIMDSKKILLVNLSKGRLGDINSSLLGLIIVGKILMAALSRVDALGANLPPFYLYIDEFQNVTTDSISTILSEARKYKLSLNVAHQFIAQLDEKIKNSVFGNVGSMAVFRVGSDDAEYLEKQFAPTFSAKDIMNIDNRNAYLKLLVSGAPAKPFNIETMPPSKGDRAIGGKLKELSQARFGRDRAAVESEIMAKYEKKA